MKSTLSWLNTPLVPTASVDGIAQPLTDQERAQ